MQDEGFQPNVYTIVSLLKACGSVLDIEKGMGLHSYACVMGLNTQDFVGSALVSMYGKCGNGMEAETVFNSLAKHNIVLWNAMLSAYAEQGDGEKVWRLYEKMAAEGTEPNERTFVMLIQACCMLADKEEAVAADEMLIKVKSFSVGRGLQSDVQCKGFAANVIIGNKLIRMFGKCGNVVEAESIFSNMSKRNVYSWTAMLLAYNEQDQAEKALQLFAKMQGDCTGPNEWTFSIALQACCLLAEEGEFYTVQGWKIKDLSLDVGRSLHADARRKGYHVVACIGNILVNLYGKCGSIYEALSLYEGLPSHDVGLWNAILSAYAEQKSGDIVLRLYKTMQEEGVSPNEQTSVIALQGCSLLAVKEESIVVQERSMKQTSLEIGRAVHADAQKMGFDPDIFLGSTLVSMYGKCGSILDAENVFGRLPDQDAVSLTAMISAYGEQGLVQQAFDLYLKMQEKNVILDDGSIVSLVQACTVTGGLDLCRQIHFDILASRGDPSLRLTTAFIHAYGSCASMVDAWAVFDVLLEPDVVSWSALITGYANDGSFKSSFGTFECMKGAGIKPDEVTFLSLLSTCSHAGLVNKGVEFFKSMNKEYGLIPNFDHFVTVVDLLGRVGELERAEDMLSRFPGQPDLAMWLCLLGACQKHNNFALAKRIFSHAVLLLPDKAFAYCMMSNIYSNYRLWDHTSEVD
ncbi:hypothetical protein L7F22_063064 [Adiantum nelumboides]|nr:hypothetical protein [Adiantum nelumboides]